MPVRSLNSSVLVWPNAEIVDRAVREWAKENLQGDPNVVRAGYFGSYARGDWGVGSDLDLIIIVEESAEPFERRAVEWNTTSLPVPVDVVVYTKHEWERLKREGRFPNHPAQEIVWVYDKAKTSER